MKKEQRKKPGPKPKKYPKIPLSVRVHPLVYDEVKRFTEDHARSAEQRLREENKI